MIDRCEKRRDGKPCGYLLHKGECPVCGGKQTSDRLPMLAPLPKAPDVARARTRVYAFPRRRGAA